jgi:hypothetical protein
VWQRTDATFVRRHSFLAANRHFAIFGIVTEFLMNAPSKQNSISNPSTAQNNNQKPVLSRKSMDKADTKPMAQRYTLHVWPRDPIDAPLTAIPANGATSTPVAK